MCKEICYTFTLSLYSKKFNKVNIWQYIFQDISSACLSKLCRNYDDKKQQSVK